MENCSTYVLKIVQNAFHRPFMSIRKLFLCVYNAWLETMDAFHYFSNIYCSLRSRCKRYPMCTFARILKLWREKFFTGIWAKDIFNLPSAISDVTGYPKLAIFPNVMGSCQGQLASEHLKIWEWYVPLIQCLL